MKTEETKKQDELKDEQLDNVAGASRITDIIKDVREKAKDLIDATK